MTVTSPQGSQVDIAEEEGESSQEPMVKKDFCEIVSSGHSGATTFMNSQYLWLSTQDLHEQTN